MSIVESGFSGKLLRLHELTFNRMRAALYSYRKTSFRDVLFDLLPSAVRIGLLGQKRPSQTFGHQPTGRENRRACLCKQYLRLKYPDRLASVEEFIFQVEALDNGGDGSNWEPFIDLQSITDEVLKPLDLEFETWLRP
jgi:hypothetical protein